MTDWQNFLAAQGLAADGEHFGNLAGELHAAQSGVIASPLTDFAVIRVSGPDATTFLHNLLTQDIKNLPANGLCFAGLCTPKGRLLATFHLWREGDDFLLALSADILPAILKQLSMYVLRSKVKLAEASVALIGVAHPSALTRTLETLLGAAPAPLGSAAISGGQILRLDERRALLALTPAAALSLWPVLAAQVKPAGAATWRALEIAAGQPRVVAATQEAFVPQMLNMELPAVGGISFTKGCYPGQEIVARTQYLGKVKRRMYRARANTLLAAGTPVFTPESGNQHCGALVTVAPAASGEYEYLVVAQSSGNTGDTIFAGSPDLPHPLTLIPLPYATN